MVAHQGAEIVAPLLGIRCSLSRPASLVGIQGFEWDTSWDTGLQSTIAASERFARFTNELAEREGFEPPEPFRVQWFSRPPPSTTRPSLQVENYARIRAISTTAFRTRTPVAQSSFAAKSREV